MSVLIDNVNMRDSSGTERTTIDTDGYLYQRNTKVTTPAADLNFISGLTTNTTVVTHSYASAHADWTLSATEKLATQLICTNADAGANIVAPAENRIYWIYNNSGQTITIKKAAGTGVAIATGKYAGVYYNGTDYAKLTPDL